MFRLIRRALLGAVVGAGLMFVPTDSQKVEANDYWNNYWSWYDGSYRPYYRNQYNNQYRNPYGNQYRDYRYQSQYGNRGYRDYDYGSNYQRYPRSYGNQYRSTPRSSYQLGPLRIERWH